MTVPEDGMPRRSALSYALRLGGCCDGDLTFDERLCLVRRVANRLLPSLPEELLLELVARHLRGDAPEGTCAGRPVAALPEGVCEFLTNLRHHEPAHPPN
jgi:hypothetical protein